MVEIINTVISYAPTLLFLLIVIVASLTGLIRGFRKSLILFIHALIAAAICLTMFFILTRNEQMDAFLLTTINNLMGGESALQDALAVSKECTTLREVLIEYVPVAANFGDGITLILKENGQYLSTIVDLIYNMIFALILSIVYLALIFVLYLVYLIFYSERRYKKRIKRSKLKVYKKRRLFGALVGFGRGFIVGVITLSFLGNFLYVISGGTGKGELEEHSFGNGTYDTAYNAYRSIESYGSTGIYKVLNTFKDSNDQPYYLFAADLVFSGRLEDENLEISENIKFREEFGAYIGFAKNTANLLIKYGGEDINAMLNGTSEASMDVIVNVMEQEEFQKEFELMIEEFDGQTYFINLAFSLINSIINNIDSMDFAASMDPKMLEIVKILFKEGHYSEYIPDEREVKHQRFAKKNNNQDEESLPYLSVNKVLQKEDILTIFKMLTTLLNTEALENETEQQTTLRTVREILPYISELSILSSERKSDIDPVLGRLYCFVENAYLTEEGQDGVTYEEIKTANISWVDEINSLIDLAVDALKLVENVYVAEQEVLDIMVSVFDSSNENYSENMEIIDSITSTIENSKMLGKVLSSSVMKSTIVDTLSNTIPNMYLNDGLSFVNKYDENGNVTEYGELHQLFAGFKLIGKTNDGQVLKSLINSQETEIVDLLDQVALILDEKDENDKTVTDYLLDSKLLHSMISAVLVNSSEGEDAFIYITEEALQKDENNEIVNLIKKDELKEIFDDLPEILDVTKPLLEEGVDFSKISDILDSQVFGDLLDKNNLIIEGTFANVLLNTLSDIEMIVIPKELEVIENWMSTDDKNGEIKNIVNFIRNSSIELDTIIEGEDKLSALSNLTDEDIEALFTSKVLHYTVSNYIDGVEMGSLKLIVPNSTKDALVNDTISYLIKKEELEVLFNQLVDIELSTDMDNSKLMSELVVNFIENDGAMLESDIIVASITNFICNNNDVLTVPNHLLEQGQESVLIELTDTNLWHDELYNLIYTLEEIFEISTSDSFEFNSTELTNKTSNLLNEVTATSVVDNSKTKMDVIYKSDIMKHIISTKLDEVIVSEDMLTSVEVSDAKQTTNYTLSDSSNYAFTYYSKEEIIALSNCLYAFGITDLVGDGTGSSADLAGDVKDKISTLNDAVDVEKFGADVSTIDLIYESIIIKTVFSKELDKVLTDDMINQNVLQTLKDSQPIYPKSQLEKLVDSINTLEITNMDEMSEINFNGVKEKLQDDEKFNVIYASDIVAGIISKKVYDITLDNSSILKHYELAFKENIDIYKNNEIKCLVDLIGENDINTMSMENLKLNKSFIANYIYDSEGNTASYLIVSTLSHNLLSRTDESLIIPYSTIDNTYDTIIKPSELSDLFNALFAIMGLDQENDEVSISDLNTSEQLRLPEPNARQAILDCIITRASITNMIRTMNEPGDGEDTHVFVTTANIEKTIDKDNQAIVIISETELTALFTVLDGILPVGAPLEIPEFGYASVMHYKMSVEDVYASDITRIKLVTSIINAQIEPDKTEEVYDLWDHIETTKPSLTLDKINGFIKSISA